MDDTNPYASPRSDVSAAPPDPGAEEPSAWRDGGVLVARRRGAVLPRACVKSNRAYRLGRLNLVTLPVGWEVLNLAVHLAIPFVGFFLYPSLASRLIRIGQAGSVPVWTRVGRVVLVWICAIVVVPLILAGEVLKVSALLGGGIWVYLAGAAVSGGNYLFASHLESLFLGVRLKLVAPDLVRIRGVHREYLARLPELDCRPRRPPLDGRPTA